GNPRAIPVRCPDAGRRGSPVDPTASFRQRSVSRVSFGGEGTAISVATHYIVDDLAPASGQPACPALVTRHDPGLCGGLIAVHTAGIRRWHIRIHASDLMLHLVASILHRSMV